MSLQPPTKPVYLVACGTTTPVGLTTAQTAAAVRSGISAFESSAVHNRQFQPMTMALLPEDKMAEANDKLEAFGTGLTARQIRMLKLSQLALADLKTKYEDLNGLPLMLAGPETLPGLEQACYPELIQHIQQLSEIEFHAEHNYLMGFGRAAGVRALQYAMAYVEAGLSDYAMVGGVDSYLDLYLLDSLDMQGRVLADGVMDGFAPGEGAAFLVISSKATPFENSGRTIRINPPGMAKEAGHRYSDEPYRGDGLAAAFRAAMKDASLPAINTIVACLNGENFGAKELGVALTRNHGFFAADYKVTHPAECFGDIGAAFLPAALGLAAMGFVKKYLKGPALCYASSDGMYRGSVCLSAE